MFEAYNENGSLQLNASTFAYHYISKGTAMLSNRFTINEDGSDGIYLETVADVVVSGGWDIVVFSSPNVAIIPTADTYQGIANRFTIVADALVDGFGNYEPSTYSTPAYYWVFKSARNILSPSSSGIGLEIYNADGSVCYSSINQKPLLGKNNAQITSFSSSWTASVNLPTGRTYAHMLYGTVKNSPFRAGIKTRADGWEGKAVVRQDGTLDNVVAGGFLTVDVTGY